MERMTTKQISAPSSVNLFTQFCVFLILLFAIYCSSTQLPIDISSRKLERIITEVDSGSPLELLADQKIFYWVTKPQSRIVVVNNTRENLMARFKMVLSSAPCGQKIIFDIEGLDPVYHGELASQSSNKEISYVMNLSSFERKLLSINLVGERCPTVETDGRLLFLMISDISVEEL